MVCSTSECAAYGASERAVDRAVERAVDSAGGRLFARSIARAVNILACPSSFIYFLTNTALQRCGVLLIKHQRLGVTVHPATEPSNSGARNT